MLLPTPEPAKIPIRCPLPQVSIASIARTPVASGSTIRGRSQGRGGATEEGGAVCQGRLRLAVHGVAVRVQHAAQQFLPHAEPPRGARQANAIAVTHAGRFGKGIQQRQVVAKADHLGQQRLARLPLDLGQAPTGAGNPAAATVIPTVPRRRCPAGP